MASTGYRYSARPTRNPLRYVGAVWRLLRRDPETTTSEAATVEMGFARSKLGRRFARWEEVADHLRRDPRTAAAMSARKAFGPVVLDSRTQPLFGADWDELWEVPIDELRDRFEIDRTAIVGEGIRAAA